MLFGRTGGVAERPGAVMRLRTVMQGRTGHKGPGAVIMVLLKICHQADRFQIEEEGRRDPHRICPKEV